MKSIHFIAFALFAASLAFGQGRNSNSNNAKLTKQYEDLLAGHRPAVKEARHATVNIVVDGKQRLLGTVVHPNGWVLTKLSEIADGKEFRVMVGESLLPAKLDTRMKNFDLALLKAEVRSPLKAVELATGKAPALGTFLAAAAPGREDPLAVGVYSVEVRDIPLERAFLGVSLDTNAEGVRIEEVIEGSAAAAGGLKDGDKVVTMDGKTFADAGEFIEGVRKFEPGDNINLVIDRGGEKKTFNIQLRKQSSLPAERQRRFDRMNRMGGKLSARANGFPAAFQTDLPISPEECGGPVCDLDGQVVGINIARAGRIKTYVIPSTKLSELLKDVDFGPAMAATAASTGVAETGSEAMRSKIEVSLAEVRAAQKALELAEAELLKSLKALEPAAKD